MKALYIAGAAGLGLAYWLYKRKPVEYTPAPAEPFVPTGGLLADPPIGGDKIPPDHDSAPVPESAFADAPFTNEEAWNEISSMTPNEEEKKSNPYYLGDQVTDDMFILKT